MMGTIITVVIVGLVGCILLGFLILAPFYLIGGVVKRFRLRNKLLELELQDKLRDRSRDEELIRLLGKVEKKAGDEDVHASAKVLSLIKKI